MPQPKDIIRTFLEETFLFQFGDVVGPTSDLFKEGVIDSYGYIELVRFLEREFGITLSDEELLSNVLVSLDDMTAFVEQRLAARAHG
jgi:D-alanine--poly(phosphoribitol) ligase subunit 2